MDLKLLSQVIERSKRSESQTHTCRPFWTGNFRLLQLWYKNSRSQKIKKKK